MFSLKSTFSLLAEIKIGGIGVCSFEKQVQYQVVHGPAEGANKVRKFSSESNCHTFSNACPRVGTALVLSLHRALKAVARPPTKTYFPVCKWGSPQNNQ